MAVGLCSLGYSYFKREAYATPIFIAACFLTAFMVDLASLGQDTGEPGGISKCLISFFLTVGLYTNQISHHLDASPELSLRLLGFGGSGLLVAAYVAWRHLVASGQAEDELPLRLW